MVTPASMCCSLTRSRSAAAAAASSTRVLTPSASTAGSAHVRGDALATGDEVAHSIGQVELALRVRGVELVERGPDAIGREDVDRGVHLARSPAAPRVASAASTISRDAPVRAPDDPAVRARIVGLEGEHGRGGSVARGGLDEPLQQLGGEQRRVT